MTEDELIAVVRKQTPADDLAPVATPAVIAAVEAEDGHPMPRFLRRLYAEVSNGGFGTNGWECASLSPLPDHYFCDGEDILALYRGFTTPTQDLDETVPPGIVPIMDRGCTMWTLVDFRTPDGRIWIWDGNECCRKLCPTTITSVREYFAEGIAGRPNGPGPPHSQLIRARNTITSRAS
ncbi:SMI1/KNR4 family protein [Streptomyces sp. E2N166]|uniref:SMI1/KNR4 family protein n=1 Tax=Streptomyces sp. E2N166 TaxID=1851909 RepID=UPI000EF703B3|nr:SMI1/KNR4 family protein [Streptomyces sp. E2N166]